MDIGAKVKFSESGQIQVVDDDGNVSLNTTVSVRLGRPRHNETEQPLPFSVFYFQYFSEVDQCFTIGSFLAQITRKYWVFIR